MNIVQVRGREEPVRNNLLQVYKQQSKLPLFLVTSVGMTWHIKLSDVNRECFSCGNL